MACWLLHRVADIHVTDAGNAGRSLLCPLGGADWDDDLLELFGVPRALLPPMADSDRIEAMAAIGLGGGEVPVRAVAGTSRRRSSGSAAGDPAPRR